MTIEWLDNRDLRPTEEPLMALISIDGSHAYVSSLDEGFEHLILFRRIKGNDAGFEEYFRIIFDHDGADWTFVCPPDYKGINVKEKRIESFYKDGFSEISAFLKEIGYPVSIDIPKRYRRHLDYLSNSDY